MAIIEISFKADLSTKPFNKVLTKVNLKLFTMVNLHHQLSQRNQNYLVILPHGHTTTVSFKTDPLSCDIWLFSLSKSNSQCDEEILTGAIVIVIVRCFMFQC